MTTISLDHLKSTVKRKVLVYLFTHPDARTYLREFAGLLQLDPSNLARALKDLESDGLIESEFSGKQKYFSLNREHLLFEELKAIIEKTWGTETRRPEVTRKESPSKSFVYVVAGPNGAGKTTFAEQFLPEYAQCRRFINADLIARGLSPFEPDLSAIEAGRLLLKQIRTFSSNHIDFGFETTLAGKSYVNLFRELQRQGYDIHLFFLWIPNMKLSLQRIKDRVKRGGHHIPDDVVKRRFGRGIEHLFRLYAPFLASWTLFDNSNLTPRSIAAFKHERLEVFDSKLLDYISKPFREEGKTTHA